MAFFNEWHVQSSKNEEYFIEIRHSSDEVNSRKTGKRACSGKMSGQVTPEQVLPEQVLALLPVLYLVVLSLRVLLCLVKLPKLDLLLTAHVLNLRKVNSEGILRIISTTDTFLFSFVFLKLYLHLHLFLLIVV